MSKRWQQNCKLFWKQWLIVVYSFLLWQLMWKYEEKNVNQISQMHLIVFSKWDLVCVSILFCFTHLIIYYVKVTLDLHAGQ